MFLIALCPRRLHLDNWKKHSQEIPRSISRLGCCRASVYWGAVFPRLLELYFCAPASAQSCLKWRSPTVPDSHFLSAKRAGAPHPWHPTIDLDPPTIKRCHSCVTGIWGRKISSLTSVIFKIIDCISSSYLDKLYILVVSLPRCSLLKSKEIVQNRLAGLTNGPFCS